MSEITEAFRPNTKSLTVSDGSRRSPANSPAAMDFEVWRAGFRAAVQQHIDGFVSARCEEHLTGRGGEAAASVLTEFVRDGKSLRSTFAYLGWRCGSGENKFAVRAAASLELLHAFALLQDDVMDDSQQRRGRPAAHVQLADWHRRQGLFGSARFGEAAAVLLADMCLVWAEQMLRECGLNENALARAWSSYDGMRSELAAGQLADLLNDVAGAPALDQVLDIARRKSGNYTVRRPLELGANLAGCAPSLLAILGEYGTLIGEAFQIRDDLLGVFGHPSVTGKPIGDDVRERKATTVVTLAQQSAVPGVRAKLREVWQDRVLDDAAVEHACELIESTGARGRAERMIDERVDRALHLLDGPEFEPWTRHALTEMALVCSDRAS